MISNRKTNRQCVISWKSKRLRRVVSSSTAAEVLAINATLDEMIYVKEVLKEVFGEKAVQIPLELFTDSKNLYGSVMSTSLHTNPRLRTGIAKLNESLIKGVMSKFYLVTGQNMLANSLTKKGVSSEPLRTLLRRGRI